MTVSRSERSSALFLAGPSGRQLRALAQGMRGRHTEYRISEVRAVVGPVPPALAPGWTMLRLENDGPTAFRPDRRPASPTGLVLFRGVTENLHYTTHAQQAELGARARPEFPPSQDTIAVLIPVGKSAEWWNLPQDARQAFFEARDPYPGHTAIGQPYVDRVFRKLYHSRYLPDAVPYDFLTYFEFDRAHVDDFRRLLAALRDVTRNPEWAYVALEYEIWTQKLGSWPG